MATKEVPYLVSLAKGDEVEDSIWHNPRIVESVRFEIVQEALYITLQPDKSSDFEGLKQGYQGHKWQIAY